MEAEIAVEVSHSPVYVAGNYTKLARNISQTPWTVDPDTTTIKTAVEDIIGEPLKAIFEA